MMKPTLLKDNQYKLLIDIQNKQIIISKKNALHFYCHKKILFSKIDKIIFELDKNKSFHFIIETLTDKTYTVPILLNHSDENDFIIFLMFLKNSHLYIEDKKHMIDNILKNDLYLEKLY